jgi:hypothetical protein
VLLRRDSVSSGLLFGEVQKLAQRTAKICLIAKVFIR